MSTRWERLAGGTGIFALKLAFGQDPDDGQAAEPDVSPGAVSSSGSKAGTCARIGKRESVSNPYTGTCSR